MLCCVFGVHSAELNAYNYVLWFFIIFKVNLTPSTYVLRDLTKNRLLGILLILQFGFAAAAT